MKARREDADAANAVDDDDGNDLGCGGGDVVHAQTAPNELSIRNDTAAATAVVVILMLMVQWMSSSNEWILSFLV